MNLAIFRRDMPVLSATILAIATIFVAHQHPGRRAAGAHRPAHPPVVCTAGEADALQDTIAADPFPSAVQRARGGQGLLDERARARATADKVTMRRHALHPVCHRRSWSIAAPLVTTHDPDAGLRARALKSPGYPGHWLGTDEVGRDLWSRIVYGGRLSLLCGVCAVLPRAPRSAGASGCWPASRRHRQ